MNADATQQNMTIRDYKSERQRLEKRLEGSHDFTAAYLTVRDLSELIATRPQIVGLDTIAALRRVLENGQFSSETQAFFLYREAAAGLVSIIVQRVAQGHQDEAVGALKHLVGVETGDAQRAAAVALGSLPLSICGPKIAGQGAGSLPRVRWEDVLKAAGIDNGHQVSMHGRSAVVAIDGREELLVVKLARPGDDVASLQREALWMDHLRSGGYSFPLRFDVPEPVKIQGFYACQLDRLPVPLGGETPPHSETHAVCFLAHGEYFTYPQEHVSDGRGHQDQFLEVMCRNAWLLGHLASRGIIHSASIPLFHNRIQRHRRDDRGFYEWPRGGRLDRWLSSCSYPNFGHTGIRDFEHFVGFNGSGQRLYNYIGTQLLSLLLVAGSYFRNKDRERVGLDQFGNPVDARDLFEEPFLKGLVAGIFRAYYEGFVGAEWTGKFPLDLGRLTGRMIEEMGVDRHMEEILRAVDQQEMSEEQFRKFLKEEGSLRNGWAVVRRGAEDITVLTGPHLGGFNEQISLPELTESVGAVSALCIAGRYWRRRFSSPLP